jgi:hypothetical protein
LKFNHFINDKLYVFEEKKESHNVTTTGTILTSVYKHRRIQASNVGPLYDKEMS